MMSPGSRSALVWLSLGAVAGAGLLEYLGSRAFTPYFGTASPALATGLVALVGVAALASLDHRGWFSIHVRGRERRVLLVAAGSATALSLPAIAVDVLGGFPRDINVQAPESVVFYPVIAVVAELVFHAVPLAVLLVFAGRAAARVGREPVVRLCIVVAALVEPLLQVLWAPVESPSWATAFVALHVFAFNLIALYLWKRHDFVTTYLFRAFYYLNWHVLWGFLRLRLLFAQ